MYYVCVMNNAHAHATTKDIREAVQALRDDLIPVIRESETKLMEALYGYAESNRKRMTQQEAEMAFLLNRIATLEDRLLKIEKRLNLPSVQ
jgi:hypothetical protein